MERPVTVVVRTRPTVAFDEEHINLDDTSVSVRVKGSGEEALTHRSAGVSFKYHHVLHNASQDAVYSSAIAPLIPSVAAGVSACVCTYGQTGSGKTFTMIGDPLNFRNRGVAPRAIAQLFGLVDSKPEIEFSVAVSYMEIYNDRISDLLEKSRYADTVRGGLGKTAERERPDYAILDDPTHGVIVRGLTLIPVTTEEEALNALFSGETARITAEHSLNKNSNRSHCIFTLHVRQRSRLGGGKEKITVSKLHLVDLAGSERLKKTMLAAAAAHPGVTDFGVDSETAKESMYINRSLTYLEQCIVALNHSTRAHVPYRQSKLTSVLKDALGGNSALVFIACVWGEARHTEETISTLRLAARMMNVHNEIANTNVLLDEHELVKKYERTIAQLQQELQMHDALVERGDMVYSEYTPEQQAALAAKLRAYVAADTEEAEAAALKLESVQQMRELLKQMKIMLRQAATETEERLRERFAFVPRDGGGPAAPAPAVAVAQTVTTATKGKAAPASTPAGPITMGTPAPTHAPTTAPSAVGDLDERISGLSLGLAPAHARPPTQLLPTAMAGRAIAGGSPYAGSHSATPNRTGAASSPTESPGAVANLDARMAGASMPTDINAAWKQYRHASSQGGELAADISRLKTTLQERKSAAVAAAREANAAKQRIDTLIAQLTEWKSPAQAPTGKASVAAPKRPGSTAVPSASAAATVEEEARVLAQITEAKAAYKHAREQYASLKDAADALSTEVDTKTARLLREFDGWYASRNPGSKAKLPVGMLAAISSSSPPSSPSHYSGFPVSPLRGATSDSTSFRLSSAGNNARGDALDDAEAFDKLERERVSAAAPESVAFFNATRKLRQSTRPHPRRSHSP